MKLSLTTHFEIIFISEIKESLGLTKKNYLVETHLCEKPTKITDIDKVPSKGNGVDRLVVNDRQESFFSFSLKAPLGFKLCGKPTSILFEKVNKTRSVV